MKSLERPISSAASGQERPTMKAPSPSVAAAAVGVPSGGVPSPSPYAAAAPPAAFVAPTPPQPAAAKARPPVHVPLPPQPQPPSRSSASGGVPQGYSFTVRIRYVEKGFMGIQVGVQDDGVFVKAVKEAGAIPDWNRQSKQNGFPQNCVQEKDLIVRANGTDLAQLFAGKDQTGRNEHVSGIWAGKDDKRDELRCLLLTVLRRPFQAEPLR